MFLSANEEQADKLESQLKEDKFNMAEWEQRYVDVARALATMKGELERRSDRRSTGKMSPNSENIVLCGNVSLKCTLCMVA